MFEFYGTKKSSLVQINIIDGCWCVFKITKKNSKNNLENPNGLDSKKIKKKNDKLKPDTQFTHRFVQIIYLYTSML